MSAFTQEATPLWLWSLEKFSETPQKSVRIGRAPISGRGRSPRTLGGSCVPETVGKPGLPKVVVARVRSTPITEWTDAAPALSNTDKPRWAPNGRVLYFLTNRGGFQNLAGIRFDPDRGITIGQPFDVTHFSSPSLIVSPLFDRTEIGIAAHRAMLTMVSSTGSIWMLDNVDK